MTPDLKAPGCLVEIIRANCVGDPDQVAFTYLDFQTRSGRQTSVSLTRAELDARARAVAAELTRLGARGERALLLYRAGVDFVVGFMGCLYAGVVAVPSSVPRQGWGADRVKVIAAHSGARFALSTVAALRATSEFLDQRDDLRWILTDELTVTPESQLFEALALKSEETALLQYSSGSTGNPKGVMISRANLLQQAQMISDAFELTTEDCVVSWLPNYHDMGLITSVVVPLYRGVHCVLMAPEAFVLRPARWLQELSERRVRCCVAPDFAYELCARKVTDEEMRGIDLSHLRFAMSGAEPIRARTLERFGERFADRGFSVNAFTPVYGLAEATLMVAGSNQRPTITAFEREQTEGKLRLSSDPAGSRSMRLVSCGRPYGDNRLLVVDPESRRPLPPLHTGEIWVSGSSVGAGYWGDAESSEENFGARLADDNGIRFLRTGDLGFMHDGDIYVRGRLKDLILIRGSNHHAPDIEMTAESCHPALAASGGAAFSIDVEDEERLVVVHELERDGQGLDEATLAHIASIIRQRITEKHQITPYAVLLLARGLPKTTSGKVRRNECRARYQAGQLKAVFAWQASTLVEELLGSAEPVAEQSSEKLVRATRQCEHWLVAQISRATGLSSDRIDLQTPMLEFGLSPGAMIDMVRNFEKEFGVLVTMVVFLEHENVQQLAAYLGTSIAAAQVDEPGTGGRLTAAQLQESQGHFARPGAGDAVAIIGMACRFPSAHGPQEFWANLCQGLDAVGEVPPERWDNEALYDENPLAQGKMNTRRGGFLSDVELFDRKFFGIPAREATRMDPAHRLLLEISWEALEDAGIAPDHVSGERVGVYVGISGSDYAQLQFGDEMLSDAYAGVGCALTNSASRISHFLNLRGPALAVDTACSSSLSALHLATSAIRSGECRMALAGGVNIILSPTVTMSLSKAGMMAPDGRCKTFDKRADGYVRSEGAGLVLLKPLTQAIADRDRVYAVIRGSASNQDGKSSGISAPNGEAQQRVILAACENAGIAPGDLDYIEAHGTGTALGDPIEVNALGEVLKIGAQPGKTYRIGSVKTNIGHTESAAGIASIIKAALILQHKRLPPSLNFEEPNPLIPFERYNIAVQQTLEAFGGRGKNALVGVNSFGIGGTNVHFVLEERTDADPSAAVERSQQMGLDRLYVLPLSARSEKSLKANAAALAEYLRQADIGTELADVEFTLGQRRAHLEHRIAVIGSERSELITALDAYVQTGYHPDVQQAHALPGVDERPKLAFVFSGQGPQWWAMGRQLYASERVFRECIERCDGYLRPHTGWSLIELLQASESDSKLHETVNAQPALFALQCALAKLLSSWGIEPDAVVGHSLGELAAAHIAGSLSLEEGCRLVAVRAELMQQATGKGLMASIEMTRLEVERELVGIGDALTIAASNSPGTTVVSGDRDALESLLAKLKQRGIVAVMLPVNYAFHSAQMEPTRRELVRRLADLKCFPPTVPFMSTVAADWRGDDLPLGAHYWGENVRREVRFSDAIIALGRSGVRVFLEIGPSPVLSGAINRNLKSAGLSGEAVMTLERDTADQRALARCVAALHTQQRSPTWALWRPQGCFLRGLPHYHWDRQRYWMDGAHHEVRRRMSAHPLVSLRMPVAQPTWQSRLDNNVDPYLTGLRIRGRARLAYGVPVELALEAAYGGADQNGVRELLDLQFGVASGTVDPGQLPVLQTTVNRSDGVRPFVTISAQTDDSQGKAESWHPVMSCQTQVSKGATVKAPKAMDIGSLRARFSVRLSALEVYRKLAEIGAEYAPTRQVADEIWLDEEATLIGLRAKEMFKADIAKYQLHPLIFEGVEQAARLCSGSKAAQLELAHIGRIRLLGDTSRAAYLYARSRELDEGVSEIRHGGLARSDVWVLDENGALLASMEGISFRAHKLQADEDFHIPTDIDQWRYRVNWLRSPLRTAEFQSNTTGAWLVLSDQGGVAASLSEWLIEQGQHVVLVARGKEFAMPAQGRFTIDVASVDDLGRVLREAFVVPGVTCMGVLHLWGMDADAAESTTAATIAADQTMAALSVIRTVQAISNADLPRAPRLWLVTRGAQIVAEDTGPIALSQTPIWGCAKTIVLEHAELRCARADLSSNHRPEEIVALGTEILLDDIADQVVFRGGDRYVAQLEYQCKPPEEDLQSLSIEAASSGVPFRLQKRIANSTSLDMRQVRRTKPGIGEVELRVHFAQVVAVADSDAAQDLRVSTCIGRIVRLGSECAAVEIGQLVVALSRRGSPGSHLVVRACDVAAIPSELDVSSVVASLRPLVSALFALRDLAGVNKGDKVLIRSDGGDASVAAIQIARMLGARVFVTAPSLRHADLSALRVDHLFDETDPSSFIAVRTMTDGVGVDVLLNLIDGLDASTCMLALRGFGRCIDLAPAAATYRFATSMMPSNISWQRADLDGLVSDRPEHANKLLSEVVTRIRDGSIKVVSSSALDFTSAVDAFSPSQQASMVLSLPTPADTACDHVQSAYRADATYLISGGLGGLGLKIAERMIHDGARHLVLCGRRAPGLAAMDKLAEFGARGAHCMTAEVDVADAEQVRTLLERIRTTKPALRGIIHAAGILDNGLITQMDEAQFRSVMPAKVDGAWNLHCLTQGDALDFFVMFSSLASIIGSPGQSNYAAANAFLEGLSEQRRVQGLPGLSIAWGPWADVGMAADAHNLQRLEQHGMGMVVVDKGLDLLEDLILERQSGVIGALPMNWSVWGKSRGYAARTPYFSGLVPAEAVVVTNIGKITADSLAGKDAERQLEQLQAAILRALCQAMMLDADTVEVNVPLTAIGLDSIVALELKDRIESSIEVTVRTSALIGGKSIRALAIQFRDELVGAQAAAGSAGASVAAAPLAQSQSSAQSELLDGLDELSQEEIESLLMDLEAEVK